MKLISSEFRNIILIVLIVIFLEESQSITIYDYDNIYTTPQLIKFRKFNYETHYITTKDGYILQIFRIINPYLKTNRKYSKPILVQHGLITSSDDWLRSHKGFIDSNGIYTEYNRDVTLSCDGFEPEYVGDNLVFMLSVCGYDIWLGNSRGNRYSTNHTHLNTEKDHAYWRFSFDEMAKYDLPAVIYYILRKTKKSYIGYIGISLGTCMTFARLASKPSFETYLKPIIMLAPVAHVGNLDDDFFLPYAKMFGPFLGYFSSPFPGPLTTIVEWTYPKAAEDFTTIDQTSFRNAHHIWQMVESKCFRKYDYGNRENLLKYNQTFPPNYPLCNITSKHIALINSNGDGVANPSDVAILHEELDVPLILSYTVPEDNFSHSDFVHHKNSGRLINAPILRVLSNY